MARAPSALRGSGLVAALEAVVDVVDHGDATPPPPVSRRDPETHLIDPEGLKAMVSDVEGRVAAILAEGLFPLVVGGDCPILLGCLRSFGRDDDHGLLFVDGHEDAYPPERSTTGEAADMELGFALGIVDAPWWPELQADRPLVPPERVRLLGARDGKAIEAYGSTSLRDRVRLDDASTVAGDPAGITADAVRSLSASPWWFHLDLDVLSTDALAAVDYPQDGGLGWNELETVASIALAAGPVGWDVTIYNPDLDPSGDGARRIVRFIADAIGSVRSTR